LDWRRPGDDAQFVAYGFKMKGDLSGDIAASVLQIGQIDLARAVAGNGGDIFKQLIAIGDLNKSAQQKINQKRQGCQ
jgi:hypothetical protein